MIRGIGSLSLQGLFLMIYCIWKHYTVVLGQIWHGWVAFLDLYTCNWTQSSLPTKQGGYCVASSIEHTILDYQVMPSKLSEKAISLFCGNVCYLINE